MSHRINPDNPLSAPFRPKLASSDGLQAEVLATYADGQSARVLFRVRWKDGQHWYENTLIRDADAFLSRFIPLR